MMTRPAIYNMDHTIPISPYLYRLGEGLLVASRAFVWRDFSSLKDRQMMKKIARYLMILGTAFFLYLAYKLKK